MPETRDYAATGRYDQGAERRTVRRGRERGCWLYIPALELRAAGLSPDDPPPTYRLWSGRRGRFVLNLYPVAADRAAYWRELAELRAERSALESGS